MPPMLPPLNSTNQNGPKSIDTRIQLEPAVAPGCVDGSTPMVWYGMAWYGMAWLCPREQLPWFGKSLWRIAAGRIRINN